MTRRLLLGTALIWVVSPTLPVENVAEYLNRETALGNYGIGVTSVTVSCWRSSVDRVVCRVWHWKQ